MGLTYASTMMQQRSQALINAMGPSPTMQILDASSNVLATVQLPNPPAVYFNDAIVFQGILNITTVSSLALVGAVPTSASIVSSGGQVLISGIPVLPWQNGLIIATSSPVNPGNQLGLLSAQIVGT